LFQGTVILLRRVLLRMPLLIQYLRIRSVSLVVIYPNRNRLPRLKREVYCFKSMSVYLDSSLLVLSLQGASGTWLRILNQDMLDNRFYRLEQSWKNSSRLIFSDDMNRIAKYIDSKRSEVITSYPILLLVYRRMNPIFMCHLSRQQDWRLYISKKGFTSSISHFNSYSRRYSHRAKYLLYLISY